MEKRIFTYITMGLLVWAFLGTIATGYYFVQYNTYESEYQVLVAQLNTYNEVVNNLVDGLADYNDLVSELDANMEDIRSTLDGVALKVNILLSFDAESRVWYNDTVLPLGATAFTAVYSVADDIEYTDSNQSGIFVTSINGVANEGNNGWLYWIWMPADSEWNLPLYSIEKYILRKGDVIAFTYRDVFEWPPPPPT